MITATIFSSIVIILLILRINSVMKVYGCSEDEQWNGVEAIIALLFGWIGVGYILVQYYQYILPSNKNQ